MDRVTEADLPPVMAFLQGRVETSMFPLSNLSNFGLDGDDAYAPMMWARHEGGAVTGVLTVTRGGSVFPSCAPEDAVAALKGREITGILGDAAFSRPLIDALDLTRHAPTVDRDEPQFTLNLARLRLPDGPGRLHPLQAADPEQMIAWRAAYEVEVLGQTPDKAALVARRTYRAAIARHSHRVLMDGDTPLAMTGFNARLPGIVQIGGVFTPPELRGRGLARRAVALHLREARDDGAKRATLCAANPNAARAYQAIGFERIGDWTLLLLPGPTHV